MPAEGWIMVAWTGVVTVCFALWLRVPRQRRERIRLWEWLGLLLSVFAPDSAPHVESPKKDSPHSRKRAAGNHTHDDRE